MNGTVLIIDDDADIREMLALVLSVRGYRVVTAAGGREALALMKRSPPPGVVLLDLMMPEMDGAQFMTVLREDPELSAIPVLLLSGDARVAEATGQLGAAGYLRKPVELTDLVATIERYVGGDTRSAGPTP